jgi:hypothetical protein
MKTFELRDIGKRGRHEFVVTSVERVAADRWMVFDKERMVVVENRRKKDVAEYLANYYCERYGQVDRFIILGVPPIGAINKDYLGDQP